MRFGFYLLLFLLYLLFPPPSHVYVCVCELECINLRHKTNEREQLEYCKNGSITSDPDVILFDVN